MHPHALVPKKDNQLGNIGMMLPQSELEYHFHVVTSKEPINITERLVFLGEIERQNDFEKIKKFRILNHDGVDEEDKLLDDTALVYKSNEGLVIITGCSHSGICNICNYAKKVCGDDRIVDIIGGFHLQNPSEERLLKTLQSLKEMNIKRMHPCHCTDLKSKIFLGQEIEIREVGSGTVLEY